jgi:hypothetical protein
MRRILRGTGMVTPVRTTTIAIGARAWTLERGITRIAIGHDLVREHPGDFMPADPHDGTTRERLRALDGRTRTTVRTGVLPRGGASTRFRLPQSGQPSTINLPR